MTFMHVCILAAEVLNLKIKALDFTANRKEVLFSTDTKCILKMSASINVVNNEDCWSHINNECAAKIS